MQYSLPNWFSKPFTLCFILALLTAFINFVVAQHNRWSVAFTTFCTFPFWAVCFIFALVSVYNAIRSTTAFKLARTLHLDLPPPYRPTVNTSRSTALQERDITTVTPTSARLWGFNHV